MQTYKVKNILEIFKSPETKGDIEKELSGVASLADATQNDLSFLGNKKYTADVAKTKAGAILLPKDYKGEIPETATAIFVANPSVELAKIGALIEEYLWPEAEAYVHKSAIIADSAKVAASAVIGPNVVIEDNVIIGERVKIQANNFIGRGTIIKEDAVIMPNAVVMGYCEIGKRVRVQPGAIIGSDGYGYEYSDGKHLRVPQVGKVVLEDDVDIGANTTIDRARFEKTIIGEGTKIDNLVQIAHNVKTGKGCLIVSQAGISGSSTLGNYCILGGQAGVAGHLKLEDGAKIGAQSGVSKNVEAGAYMRGTPARPMMQMQKMEVLFEKLPDIVSRISDLEKKLGIEKKTFR